MAVRIIQRYGHSVRAWFSNEFAGQAINGPVVQEGEAGYLFDTDQDGVYRNGVWIFYKSQRQILNEILTLLTEATPAPVYDDDNPLPTRLTENNPVQTKTKVWVSQQVQIPYGATSGALDANDALGDKFVFDTSVDGEPLPRKGRILSIRRIDPSDVTLADTIHIFTEDFTAAASDAAFTFSAADARYHVTSQTFAAEIDLGSAKSAVMRDVNEDYYSAERKLVCQESTTGTPTPTAGGMPILQIFILDLD